MSTAVCPDGLDWCTDHLADEDEPGHGTHRHLAGGGWAAITADHGPYGLLTAPTLTHGAEPPVSELTVSEAREFAAALTEAADVFERIGAGPVEVTAP